MQGLKQFRKKAGLSQSELAIKIGLTLKTIYNYESGKHEPNFETLKKMAQFFDCTIDELM